MERTFGRGILLEWLTFSYGEITKFLAIVGSPHPSPYLLSCYLGPYQTLKMERFTKTVTIKLGDIEQFLMFFLNKTDCLTHGSNTTNVNQHSLSFPNAKTTGSLHMPRIGQINTAKVAQTHQTKMGPLWTKRYFVARKTYLKFSLQNINNLWHSQIE